jgi:CubicO group peptidase (beta-lactamase class C family)
MRGVVNLRAIMGAEMFRIPCLLTAAAAVLFAQAAEPGSAVLVRRNGQTISQEFHGVRDPRTRIPIDAVTDFRLASFTKQFTAMSVMLLIHDGKLRYDTRLTDVFPDFPAYGRAITIRHLLTHTSGLPDYEDLMEHGGWTATHQIQDAEALDLLRRQEHGKFAPGTSWSYSNSAYVVLGLVVAKVSGMPFRDFLSQRIFQPLGMTRTLMYVNGVNTVPNRAFGHSPRNGQYVETDQSSSSATQGDGGIYSNLEDLAKWDDALRTNRLLSAKEMAPALTPVKLVDGAATRWPAAAGDDNLAPGKPVAYGYGWFLDAFGTHPRMWHSGTTMGFRTAIERFLEDGVTVIVLSNRSDFDATAAAEKAAQTAMAGRP